MNTILLATDGSPSAEAAGAEAIELAKATGWTLRVLTIWQTPILTGFGYAPIAYDPELADVEKESAAKIARAAVAAAQAAGVEATYELREGFPSAEICEAAAETDARLIVMGAHGWGAFKRLVFGSVSSAVLHDAPAPVMIVRMTESEAESAHREIAVRASQ